MEIELYELTHENLDSVSKIDRSDISEAFVDTVSTIMEITDYGVSHHCIGHTFAVKYGNTYIGLILLGEAIAWETDPPEMSSEPFYRLMGFVVDKRFRGKGIGGKVLEMAISRVYEEFGERPINKNPLLLILAGTDFSIILKRLSKINLIPDKEGVNRPNLAGVVVFSGAVVV